MISTVFGIGNSGGADKLTQPYLGIPKT